MANIMLPVPIQTMIIQEQGVTIYYPQIVGHWNHVVQDQMNREMYGLVQWLIHQQYIEQDVAEFQEMVGTFEIKTNERNVLSVSFSNYAYAPLHAHGLSLMKSLTFDIETGKSYSLHELFKANSNFVERISEHVKKQIEQRDIPTLEPFTQISKNQDYYIADKSLVIYFPVYALTPGYYGFPMFPIPVYDLQDIVTEDGPLGRMMGN